MFKKIDLEDKAIFTEFFSKQYYENSWYSFANIFIWRKRYNTKYTVLDDTLFLKASDFEAEYFLPPFVSEENTKAKQAQFLQGINNMLEMTKKENKKLIVTGLSKEMLSLVEKNYSGLFFSKAMPDMYDYVYNTEDLLKLEGRKYHSKRNHIKKFKRLYSQYSYMELSQENSEDCLQMVDEWNKERDKIASSDLLDEKGAVIEALNHFRELGLKGGVVMLGGKVQAFTLGEMLNKDTAVIHVEKANTLFDGLYPFINNEFCKACWSDTKYINREEDMGEEGLKKAKESYYPVKLIEKYIIKEL